MIDTHCHLEWKSFDKDREQVIQELKKHLDAVVTSCPRPQDFEKTLDMCRSHAGFVFCTAGIHPEFIKELSLEQEQSFLKSIKKNQSLVMGIGECGLDYNWVKEEEWRTKQQEQFLRLISFAKALKKPLVIHSRDAYEETVEILESAGAKKVQLHMFGAPHLSRRVLDNDWLVSVNTIILKSKKHKKLVRDLPLENLMLETDAPWLAPAQLLEGKKERNTPLSVRLVAEKIAEIKRVPLEEVDLTTTQNAIRFFGLPLK